MHKSLPARFAVLLLVVFLAVPAVMAESPEDGPEIGAKPPEKPQLTNEQVQEIKQIYEQIYELKKQLIEKYQSFGILEKDKAERIIDQMEKRHERLKKNNYIPMHGKKLRKRNKSNSPDD
ncbi:MAG TPA: DUF2680 domain-containing protein [Clostridiales bacterium]|nr:DUF2680 domain-containing protein [Clostridiales bacterium]